MAFLPLDTKTHNFLKIFIQVASSIQRRLMKFFEKVQSTETSKQRSIFIKKLMLQNTIWATTLSPKWILKGNSKCIKSHEIPLGMAFFKGFHSGLYALWQSVAVIVFFTQYYWLQIWLLYPRGRM